MILFINACVREKSRTKALADYYLSKQTDEVCEIRLDKIAFPAVDEDFLNLRDAALEKGDFEAPIFGLARQFAAADEILIAAPFWDLSFPAALKQFFEQINVVGITFRYSSDGVPQGLCKAKRLNFITTSGGDYFPEEFGFGYIKALANNFYGIKDVRMIKATGLDIYGADVNKIIASARAEIDKW